MKCLRCDVEMKFTGTDKIQLGKTGWLTGDVSNLLSGALEVGIYVCPDCGKIEFFHSNPQSLGGLPQEKCPKCGKMHDFDYPKCPHCGYKYC